MQVKNGYQDDLMLVLNFLCVTYFLSYKLVKSYSDFPIFISLRSSCSCSGD